MAISKVTYCKKGYEKKSPECHNHKPQPFTDTVEDLFLINYEIRFYVVPFSQTQVDDVEAFNTTVYIYMPELILGTFNLINVRQLCPKDIQLNEC